MQKIYGLNYIRGICAILIMLYHYTTRYNEVIYDFSAQQNHTGIWWGCWAVSAFFILSAFLTVENADDKLSPGKFAIKRAIRLYPAYWIAIVLTTVVTYVVNSDMKVGLPATVANFTMLQGFLGIENVDGVYWTLRYEIWFYFIITATLFLKKRNYNVLSTIWLLCIVVLKILIEKFAFDNTIINIAKIVLMYGYAQIFIIGIVLSELLKNKKNLLAWFNLFVCCGIEFLSNSFGRFLFVIVIAAISFLFATTKIRFKYDKALNFLAEISYPLYLIHQKLGFIIISGFENMGVERWIGTVVAVSVCIILSYLIHICIEKPVIKLSKKWFDKKSCC